MRRLFLAFTLTSGLLAKIGFLEERLEKKLKRKIPWIPLKNLHLTILFLGYLKEEDLIKILEIFEKFPLNFLPVSFKIKKIDYGPPGKKRMIWLYLEKNERIEKIKKFFEEELTEKGINYQREEREYLPHINLVRLKFDLETEIRENLNWQVILKEIALFESHLKKEGAEYEKLKSIKI